MQRISLFALLLTPAFADPSMPWPRVVRTEGAVLINGQSASEFLGQLTIGPNASIRVIDNRPLRSSRYEIYQGAIILETGRQLVATAACVQPVSLSAAAVVRFDAEQQRLKNCRTRVHDGAVSVPPTETFTVLLARGGQVGITPNPADADELDKWSRASR